MRPRKLLRVLRLTAGSLLLALFFIVLSFGPLPSGTAGKVVRNNLDEGIDATPFFYTEADGVASAGDELKEALQRNR
ncbi:hypothetical protein KQI63_08210 [bacterium]|nr:hypothetical protein [bacterium]